MPLGIGSEGYGSEGRVMNWKRLLVIGLVVLAAGVGLLVHWKAYCWGGPMRYLGFNLSWLRARHQEAPLLKERMDRAKLPKPPLPPADPRELKELAGRIARLDFPECDLAATQESCEETEFRQAFDLCHARLEYEVGRIGQSRDKVLVPELIKIAEKRKYGYGFLRCKACEEMKRRVLLNICAMRFSAILALGEIKDPRAVDPLLKLIDEPVPSFAEPEELEESCAGPMAGYLGFTCAVALEALTKMGVTPKEEGLMPELLKALDEIKDQEIKEVNADFYQAARAGCKVGAASVFGAKALDAMVEKFQEPGTSESKKEAILNSISKIRDPKAIPKLKELLHHPELDPVMHGLERNLSSAAAAALAGMALPELIPEYTWMLNTEDFSYGCRALGQIKDPSTIPYLINVLQANMGNSLENASKTGSASRALAEMGPIARDAVPTLIDGLNSCDSSCSSIAKALGAIGDEAAVPALLQFVLGNPSPYISGNEAVKALGAIGTDSAVEALKKIIIGEGRAKPKEGKDYYHLLRYDAFNILWKIRGEQEKAFLCSLKEDPELHEEAIERCKDNPK